MRLANVSVSRMTHPGNCTVHYVMMWARSLLLWQVRAAAASAVAALLEGAPQRAYLGIAECRLPAKQPVRCMRLLAHLSHLLFLYQHTQQVSHPPWLPAHSNLPIETTDNLIMLAQGQKYVGRLGNQCELVPKSGNNQSTECVMGQGIYNAVSHSGQADVVAARRPAAGRRQRGKPGRPRSRAALASCAHLLGSLRPPAAHPATAHTVGALSVPALESKCCPSYG